MKHIAQSIGGFLGSWVLALAGLALCAAAFTARAADQVYQDRQTGQWVFVVTEPGGTAQKVWRYTPRNLFTAHVGNYLYSDGRGGFVYNYSVSNSPRSKQGLSFMHVVDARMVMVGAPTEIDQAALEANGLSNRQIIDNLAAKRIERQKYQAQYISKAAPWFSASISDKDPTIARSFGWFQGKDGSDLAPGKSVYGLTLRRPELPGVGIATLLGNSGTFGRAVGLPETGPLAEAWDYISATEDVNYPVLVPAVSVPVPYSGAKLAQNMLDELSSWSRLNVADPYTLADITRHMTTLIGALERRNTALVHDAARQVLQVAMRRHPSFSHLQAAQDPTHPYEPLKYQKDPSTGKVLMQPHVLHRTALRALTFNVMYLLTRYYRGE